jgi:hypothetical protein
MVAQYLIPRATIRAHLLLFLMNLLFDGQNHAEVAVPTPAGSWPLSPLPML